MIVVGDVNENVYLTDSEQFLILNELININEVMNGQIESTNRDSTYQYGSNYIDIIAVSTNLLEFIDECSIVNFNQIIITDHREFLVDVNLEDFFQVEQFEIEKKDNSRLNSRKSTHKAKFVEKVEEMIVETNLKEMIDEFCTSMASTDQLE